MEKTVGELATGDWVRTTHERHRYPRQKQHRSRLGRAWRHKIVNAVFYTPGGPSPFVDCTALVYQISRLFGHTYEIRYLCLCGRAFSERVKVSDQFEVLSEPEVLLEQLRR